MTKRIVSFMFLLVLLASIFSLASATPKTVVPIESTPISQPSLPLKIESVISDLTQPQISIKPINTSSISKVSEIEVTVHSSVVSDVESSDADVGCTAGWYSCEYGTMVCSGGGCPSYVCGDATAKCIGIWHELYTITYGSWICAYTGAVWGWESYLQCYTETGSIYNDPFDYHWCGGCCAYH